MFDPNKALPKPLACNQVWENMSPCDGGRICTGCGKLVVDFRKYKWHEIEQVQRESMVPVCGLYNPKQIDNWGQDISPRANNHKLVKLSTALLALAQLVPISLNAQTKASQHQGVNSNQKNKHSEQKMSPAPNPPLKRVISGTVIIQLADSIRRPIYGTHLAIIEGMQISTATSDSFGRFSLDCSDIFESLPDTFEIGVSHAQYLPQTLRFVKSNVKPVENNVYDIVLNEIEIVDKYKTYTQVSSTAFYTQTANPPKRYKQLSKIKLWWRQITKRNKDN